MRREARNRINALLEQVEEIIREEVTIELAARFGPPRKKPGPKPGTPRTTGTKGRKTKRFSSVLPVMERLAARPLPLLEDPPELAMYE